jgi:hypothetical protein
MYSSTPSRLKADDSAKRAKRASSHEFRNMFGGGGVVCGVWSAVCGGVLQQRERADVVEVPSGSFVGGDAFREKRFRAGLKGVSM